MIHAYDEMYINEAMKKIGNMFEYVSLDLGIDIDAFFKMFIDSKLARKFEIGNVSIIAGRSGIEIANMVFELNDRQIDFKEPKWREGKSDIYWSGWVLAYYQWYRNKRFADIWNKISIHKIIKMYNLYHEKDILQVVDAMDKMLSQHRKQSLSELRIVKGLSQRQLAELANMSISQIQRLEYGERSVENVTLKTAINLANALGVEVNELITAEND